MELKQSKQKASEEFLLIDSQAKFDEDQNTQITLIETNVIEVAGKSTSSKHIFLSRYINVTFVGVPLT